MSKKLVVLAYKMSYSHAPHDHVSVKDGPHIRRWSRKMIAELKNSHCEWCGSCPNVVRSTRHYSRVCVDAGGNKPVLPVL